MMLRTMCLCLLAEVEDNSDCSDGHPRVGETADASTPSADESDVYGIRTLIHSRRDQWDIDHRILGPNLVNSVAPLAYSGNFHSPYVMGERTIYYAEIGTAPQ